MKGLYADIGKTTKSNIQEDISFPQSTKNWYQRK